MVNFDLPVEVWTITNLTSTSQIISDLYVGGSAITIPANATIDLVKKGCPIVSITRSVNTGSISSLVAQGRVSHSGYLHSHKGSFETTDLPDATQWHMHFGLDVLTAGELSNADALHTHNNFVKMSDIDDLISGIGDIDLSIYAKISDGVSQFPDIAVTGEQINKAVLKLHEEDHTLLEHIDDEYPFTIDNFRKLFDGSNADCLHTHTFPDDGVSIHNELEGLQGGEEGQYYHLSLSRYNYFINLFDNIDVEDLISLTDGSNADHLHTHTGLILDHNEMAGLQGGTSYDPSIIPSEYYHLNYEEYSIIPTMTYTNEEGSVIEVGGIEEGTTFDQLKFDEFVDLLLYPELFPTLVDPSHTFTSSVTGLRTIGETISVINLNTVFNRGSIEPQYESESEYRSGLPNKYEYQFPSGSFNVETSDLSDSQVTNDHVVVLGSQIWRCRVHYDAGVQPKGSKGTDYLDPLDEGETGWINRTITGVYPYFATTENITEMEHQPLAQHGSTVITNVVAEDDYGNKQSVEFPEVWGGIAKLEQFNTISNQWDEILLNTFTITNTNRMIEGHSVEYKKYTHNGVKTGARSLRWST